MPSLSSVNTPLAGAVRAVTGPLLAKRTYKRLAYLILALPLTMFYWTLFSFGMVFGAVLSIVLVGVAILLVLVLVVRLLTALERWLASALLDVSLTHTNDVNTGDGVGGQLRGYLDAPSTWRGFGFLSLKSFLGIVGGVLVYGLAQGLSLVSAVVDRPTDIGFGEVNGEPVIWTVETAPEAVLATGAGICLVCLTLHLANGFGYVAERMATALLESPTAAPENT